MSAVKSTFSRALVCRPTAALPETGYSDKVTLPPSFLSSYLETLNLDHENIPSPLILRITRQSGFRSEQTSQRSIYCGVREFSNEDEEAVGIPDWLLAESQIQDGDTAVVETVKLEKASFAQLQVVGGDEIHGLDIRSVLEAHMRKRMTALFVGETVSVTVGGLLEPVRYVVSALEPADAVDVVDTDLSVDIVNVLDQHNQAAGVKSNELVAGKIQTVVLDSAGSSAAFGFCVPVTTAAIEVVLDTETGDASLFASRLVRKPSASDSDWYDVSAPSHRSKRLLIEHTRTGPGANAINTQEIYISVVSSTEKFQGGVVARALSLQEISNHAGAPATTLTRQLMDQSSQENGMVVCSNCGSSVPEQRLQMHQIMCERHNVKCGHCERIFKRGSDELAQHWHCDVCNLAGQLGDQNKHDEFYHTPCTCTCSSDKFDSLIALAEHRRTECPERLIECRYCHTYEPQGPVSTSPRDLIEGLRAHEAYCGSRSIECAKCKMRVSIRQVAVHSMVHAEKERERLRNAKPCANKECSRERTSNPLGLCAACFGQFYTGQFDPDNQKLLKRLARALHAQMTQGCKRAKCSNLHCATGSPSGPLSQNAAAAKMVPVLKAYAPLAMGQEKTIDFGSIDLHLCA
ncbi:hypothetical protein H4R99_000999 [Coemansia sp. RSA 1722]|nr:hypothetical protein IWW45_002909 [Coemansia sp. RSA 485]KAJ2601592.1 hypothetical protein GGF39_001156 [Coemansia sp. RSA 1721]KAJ2605586.1 hypothetical protein H4R99_000999 [Coemansia sp. RSA 1722]KAJ2639026.1 hypothetical protein GGF40_001209 [Coemansia sp. RSA 1286]